MPRCRLSLRVTWQIATRTEIACRRCQQFIGIRYLSLGIEYFAELGGAIPLVPLRRATAE